MANKIMTDADWAQLTEWLARMLKYDSPDDAQEINRGYWGA
jgi:hypothetical protein